MRRKGTAGFDAGSIVAALAGFVLVFFVTGAAPVSAGGGGCRESITDQTTTQVDAKDFCFIPSVVRIAVNQTVTFTNRDLASHSVTGAGMAWSEDLRVENSLVSVRFPAAGTFPYFCQLHVGMIGVVLVGNGIALAPPGNPVVAANSAPTTTSSTTTTAPPVATTTGADAARLTQLASSSRDHHGGRGSGPMVVLSLAMAIAACAALAGRLRHARRER